METISNSAIAAIKEASSIRITLDEGSGNELTFRFDEKGLCRDLSTAIGEYFNRLKRVSLRRKSFESVIASDRHGKALTKHLVNGYNLHDWSELDDLTLSELKDYMLEESGCCKNSVKTYLGRLAVIIAKYRKGYDIPCSEDFKNILKVGNDNPHKTFLDQKDLIRFEIVKPSTPKEAYTQKMFLVSAYTGCRISDASRLTRENIQGNKLVYVSQKTRVQASVPLKPQVLQWLEWLWANPTKMSLAGYNLALRRLCERAGNDDAVNVYKAGSNANGKKWQFVSSHSARISFATNLSLAGMPLQHICSAMGHLNSATTLHYIVSSDYALTAGAQQYLG